MWHATSRVRPRSATYLVGLRNEESILLKEVLDVIMDGHQESIRTDSGNHLEMVGGELALEVRVVADGAGYGENHYLDVCVVCELFVAMLFKELKGVMGVVVNLLQRLLRRLRP